MKIKIRSVFIYLKTSCILAMALSLTACEETKIVNKVMLVQTLGYDVDGKEIKGSTLMGDYTKKNVIGATFLEIKTKSVYDVFNALNSKTKSPIEYGQLGIIVFGKNYAKQGIGQVMDTLCRETRISTHLQLAVADGSASELLLAAKELKDAYLLSDMIEQNMANGNIPKLDLQRTLFSFYAKGRDVILPHLTKEQDELKVNGLALFKNEKYMFHLDLNDSLLLKLILENAKNGNFNVPALIDKDEHVLTPFNIIKSKTRFQFIKSDPQPAVAIHISILAKIKDIPQHPEYLTAPLIPQIEEKAAAHLEHEMQALLSRFHDKDMDPVGLQEFVMHQTRTKLPEGFPVDAKVHVKIDLIQNGYRESKY